MITETLRTELKEAIQSDMVSFNEVFDVVIDAMSELSTTAQNERFYLMAVNGVTLEASSSSESYKVCDKIRPDEAPYTEG